MQVKACHFAGRPPSRPMTPQQQLAMMRNLDAVALCQQPEPLSVDLQVFTVKVQMLYWFTSMADRKVEYVKQDSHLSASIFWADC